MRIQKQLFTCASVLFAGLCPAFALIETQPVLTNAVWSGDQFQFTLRGETNVAYILESSPDLRFWAPAITNSDSQATRTVIVPAASARTFWRVRPVPSALFEHAIVALGNINLGTGSGRIDSFNSTNLAESTGGMYDPLKATDRAIVATTSRTPNAISAGHMSIYGSVATGPGASVTLGNSGNVGSPSFNDNPAYNGSIEPGHHRDDFRAILPAPRLPADFLPFPLPQNVMYPPVVGGTNFNYAVLTDGDYRHPSNLSIVSGQRILINARCRIHVLGQTIVSGSGYILMGPNAHVEWYCSGQIDLSGQGVINEGGFARDISIISLSSQPVSYSGASRLIGTIYAPLSAVTLIGTSDAIGAIVCNSFTLNGTMSLHFDESLKSAGPFR